MAVVTIGNGPALFYCDQCGSPPQLLQDNEADKDPLDVSVAHNRATGHKSGVMIGNRIVVNHCERCSDSGLILILGGTLSDRPRQGEVRNGQVPCPNCTYDPSVPWQ